MAKEQENFLDYIPKHNALFEFRENHVGNIEVKVQNKGFFNKVAQVFAKRPKFSYIELDEFGSFIWREMDGQKSVYEIGQQVKQEFGEKAEPLYERLSEFIKILHKNHYVVYQNKLKKKER